MNPERLAAYRKTFGPMSTGELRAVVEGRKAHRLCDEALAAIRLLLARRKDGGQQDAANLVTAVPFGAPNHTGTQTTVRWPVACLAAVALLVTLALVVYSGRSSRPSSIENKPEASATPARTARAKPAVPLSDHDTPHRFPDEARAREQNIVRPGLPPRSLAPQRSIRLPLDNQRPATVELTGIIGISGRTEAFLQITESALGSTLKKVTVQEGDRIDSIEVLQIDVAKGQVRIRNAGVESVLTGKKPQFGAVAANSPAGSQQASFATPPRNWPPLFGELTGAQEVCIKNPNAFNVRVGLRLGGQGKDFIVPANGTQTVRVPNGRYVTYFQYSSEPEGMYQGDSFQLQNNGAQITITRVVNGNYGIRKVN